MFDTRPTVAVFVKETSLAIYLIEQLLSNFCHVYFFSEKNEHWIKNTQHLKHNINLTLVELKDLLDMKFDYCVMDFEYLKNIKNTSFETIVKKCSLANSSLLVLPQALYEEGDREKFNAIKTAFHSVESVKTVYVGELFGPRMDLGEGFFSNAIKTALTKNTILIGRSKDFFVCYVPALAKSLVVALFSFGAKEGPLYFTAQLNQQNF